MTKFHYRSFQERQLSPPHLSATCSSCGEWDNPCRHTRRLGAAILHTFETAFTNARTKPGMPMRSVPAFAKAHRVETGGCCLPSRPKVQVQNVICTDHSEHALDAVRRRCLTKGKLQSSRRTGTAGDMGCNPTVPV